MRTHILSSLAQPSLQKNQQDEGGQKKKRQMAKRPKQPAPFLFANPRCVMPPSMLPQKQPLHSTPLFSASLFSLLQKRTGILTSIITSQQHNMPCHAAYRINACRGVRGVDLTCSGRVGGGGVSYCARREQELEMDRTGRQKGVCEDERVDAASFFCVRLSTPPPFLGI